MRTAEAGPTSHIAPMSQGVTGPPRVGHAGIPRTLSTKALMVKIGIEQEETLGPQYDGFPDFKVDKKQLSNDHEELRTKTVFKVPGLLKIDRIPLHD